MKIPVTRNISTTLNDVVGFLYIPEEMAASMASCFAEGLGYKLDACVGKDGDTFKLLSLSISAVPVESQVSKPLSTSSDTCSP